MNKKHVDALDVASRQHGVITRPQALAAGLSEGAINACLANGLFVALNSEVFRVRGAPQTEAMAITAAVWSADGRASHATAARLLRFETSLPPNPIHVTVDGDHQRPRVTRLEVENEERAFFRVQVHRYADFGESITTVDGVACVDAARALIGIAPRLTAENLENAFERARKLGLLSTESLARRFALIGGRGRPGTPKIRELLANAAPNALDSKLEVKAWRMLRASRLKNPGRQVRVDLPSGRGHRLDFAWPELLVAFETEGFEWHGSRARWKQDRIRSAALERLGWRIVVATWDDVMVTPAETLDRIAMALDERRSLRWAS
jgi:very-short-patch-repair endonuclease